MNTLRGLSISRRLWLILIVAMAMLLALGLLMLKQIHDDLYEGKAQKTQHVVQAVSGVLGYYHGLETAGSLSREAAGHGCRLDYIAPDQPSGLPRRIERLHHALARRLAATCRCRRHPIPDDPGRRHVWPVLQRRR